MDYDYIKKQYRLTAVDLSRQKKIRCRCESNLANRVCWTVEKLDNNVNVTDADNEQFMFFLTILEKVKETRLESSQGNVTVL